MFVLPDINVFTELLLILKLFMRQCNERYNKKRQKYKVLVVVIFKYTCVIEGGKEEIRFDLGTRYVPTFMTETKITSNRSIKAKINEISPYCNITPRKHHLSLYPYSMKRDMGGWGPVIAETGPSWLEPPITQ